MTGALTLVAGDQCAPSDLQALGLVAIVKIATEQGVASDFVDAIIDTGATTTCVDAALAASVGLTPEGFSKHHVIGGGEANIPIARCSIGFQGGAILRDLLEVGIADLKGQCAVLIGRDVLGMGRLIVDFPSGVWAFHVQSHRLFSAE